MMLLVETHLYVAYYRVSTQRQGQSGLGLEAQRLSVSQFVNGNSKLIAEFTEIETGKRSNRPELAKAIAYAKRCGATLVIAKLDRLARNVAFISALMESGVDFVACDNPHANRLTIHILAAVAEDEARRISQRTIEALAAYKARGGRLGSHHPRCKAISHEAAKKGSPIGASRVAEQAREAYADILPTMQQFRDSGKSFRQISQELNRLGHTTRTGKQWNPVQVKRVIDSSECAL